MIRFRCPGCQSVLSIRSERAGSTVACPKCRTRLQVPTPAGGGAHGSGTLILVAAGALLVSLAAGGWFLIRWLESAPTPMVVVENPSSPGDVATTPSSQPTPSPAASEEPTTEEVPPQGEKVPQEKPAAEETPPSEPPAKEETTPPSPSPPRPIHKENKEIALADDLPPELEFHVVDAINAHRTKAGLEPIFLDAALTQTCQSRARSLARNPSRLEEEDKRDLHIAAEEPLAAIEKGLKDSAQRARILEPHLRTFGAGFAHNTAGQWFTVFDWNGGIDREPMEVVRVKDALAYPAPGQSRVPLWFPGNETPDPLPEAKSKLAGYPITLTFPPRTRLDAVTARLTNKEEGEVEVWLSWPGKPANPKYPSAQRNTICLIARKPLRPNTRYGVEVTATVNDEAWSAKWSFTTISEGELRHKQAGRLLRAVNELRRQAGLRPVPLDAERSKACAAHALYLSLNAPTEAALNWNEEKPDRPGYSEAGAAAARTAAIQGGGGPVEAVAGLVDSFISRPRLLDPHLRSLGLGYTPFARGGWIWVIDLNPGSGRDAAGKVFLYPAPDQEEVPLVYPANETPSPIPPENKERRAGYAITADFSGGATPKEASAKLLDEMGSEIEGMLSTPDKPAIASFPQRSLCFLPRAPLHPNTRYTMTFQAEIEGKPWRRTWSFTTLRQPDRYSDDLGMKLVTRLNAARKAAGLPAVRLDAELSRGCQSHARYLSLNQKRGAAHGLAVHRQDTELPGASPEGAQAAKESVIAVVLDPESCVEDWLATLYHRVPLLTTDLERVGFGHARIDGRKWACVLDTGNGRAVSP